jgi:hypothetical protein
MINSVIVQKDKKKTVVGLLSKVDKRKKYTFFIASCYFTPRSASYLIRAVSDSNININSVEIYIDKKEALKIGKKILKDWLNRINDNHEFATNIYPVDTPKLFHVKAYSLIAKNSEDLLEGIIVSGSANLTGAGLTSDNGNIEVLIETQNQNDLNSFNKSILKLQTQNLDEIDHFKNIEAFDFKYSLLQSGYFIYKWSSSLNQELAIKFRLSEEGKQKIKGDPILEELGFELSQASVSKSYLQFEYKSPLTKNITNIKRNFGVETYWGYWVPKSIIDQVFGNEEFEKFKAKLLVAFEKEYYSIVSKIEEDYAKLTNLNLIEATQKHPKESFLESIEKLKGNETKLWRLYYRYEVVDLPYNFSQRAEVEDLYDNFTETYESKPANTTIRAIYKSLDTKCLLPITDEISAD